jgi:hypothetical protein
MLERGFYPKHFGEKMAELELLGELRKWEPALLLGVNFIKY